MQYYIKVGRKKRNTAGAKAPKDISELCKRNGMICFPMPQFPSNKNSIYEKLWLFFVCSHYWRKLLKTVNRGDVVLYQHPMYGKRIAAYYIDKIHKKKGCKFIAVIHDLESLRKGIEGAIEQSEKTIEISDNKLLKQFDSIICHNEHMKQYLISRGFESEKLVSLGIFDYLCDYKGKERVKGKNPSIAVAGNLLPSKCAYIYNIQNEGKDENLSLTIHLYGEHFDASLANEGIIYHGSYSPEELPEYLEGDFGLVWDGTSTETCEGNTGEYLKYNNPHKTSLYLAAEMPVIVWEQAAIADFVHEYGVGITVDSLNNLDEIIAGISDEKYKDMCKNARGIGSKIRKGEYFTTALNKSLKIINKSIA